MSQKISTVCEKCKSKLSVASDRGGKRLRCPKCQNIVQIPVPDLAPLEPEEAFNFDAPPAFTSHTQDSFPEDQDDDDDDDPYQNVSPSFRGRTANLASELKEELIPRSSVPSSVAKLVSDDEHFLYADNPSQTSLILRLAINGILGLVANPLFYAVFGANSFLVQIVFGVLGILTMLISLYITYIAWKTRFYAITSRRIIVRTGWFNHIIAMAPVHNVQMVTIDTGFIDGWLGLNSICFETAASSGFGQFRSGVLNFRNIHSEEVMKAYSHALGKQTN